MAEKKNDPVESNRLVFDLHDRGPISSAETSKTVRPPSVSAVTSPTKELSYVDSRLADVVLPTLRRADRARLHMQTPNRLFFYWSLASDPFKLLNRTVPGGAGGYTLVIRLINVRTDAEEIHAAEPEGSRWFNVDSDSEYRAEIGLWAPNRPFIRLIFSNTVTTPRRTPSPQTATEDDWNVTPVAFSRVLSASGFRQDAFDVELGEDDADRSEIYSIIRKFILGDADSTRFSIDELRRALLYIALGTPLEVLRSRLDASLFRVLQQRAALPNPEDAIALLKQHFDIDAGELTEEEAASAVHGARGVSSPGKLFRSRTVPRPSSYRSIGTSR